MTAVSKNVYFDVLGNIVNKYNNIVHRSIKMKLIDFTSDFYAEYNEDSNVTKPKFEVGDHVRISKYKNIFAKGYTQNWSEEVFVVNRIKNTVPWTYLISDLNIEQKLLKRKGDKLYVEREGYDNSFNSWINKKDLI